MASTEGPTINIDHTGKFGNTVTVYFSLWRSVGRS